MAKEVGLIFGTRPDAVKMAPVYHALVDRGITPCLIATAQHREMLDQVLRLFHLTADHDLNVMEPRQSLGALTARLAQRLDLLLNARPLDAVLVHGDTTSCLVGALSAFYHQIPVGHVEAGLRSNDPANPFPEEINRKLTAHIATFHFAPTPNAVNNLQKEGIDPTAIFLTGNTVIDALVWVTERYPNQLRQKREALGLSGKPYILMTMHRRENWGTPMKNVISAVKRILHEHDDLHLLFPVHPNPAVREVVMPALEQHPRVCLTDPVGYFDFVAWMQGALFIMSDSGGLQEEAPWLGKPVLLLRSCTERPEAVSSGAVSLVGTDEDRIYEHAFELIHNPARYTQMAQARNPYGDGTASIQIAQILSEQI